MNLTILVVGNERQPEFSGAIAQLARFGRVESALDPDHAWQELAAGRVVPELIVVVQSYPGQYSGESIERLRRASPLCRLVALLGAWCEGELRSGQPWNAVVRLYWHQWPARASRELFHLARGECPSWGLPVTATDEERLLASATEPGSSPAGLAVIVSRHRTNYEWLAAACRQRGWAAVWIEDARHGHVQGMDAVLFDGVSAESDLLEIRELARRFQPARLVVLTDFPRADDVQRMRAAGAAAVLAKPPLLEDLFWELDQAAQHELS
jgi:hypothetical protein